VQSITVSPVVFREADEPMTVGEGGASPPVDTTVPDVAASTDDSDTVGIPVCDSF